MKFRNATIDDLPAIVKMLAEDDLGSKRENFHLPLPEVYVTAFKIIDVDPHQHLMVLENNEGEVVGTMQLSFTQYLTYQGGLRAQIEAVRIRSDHQGKGLGKIMFQRAIDLVKKRKVHLLQLTSDKKRIETLVFYETLGFQASHEGFKMHFKYDV